MFDFDSFREIWSTIQKNKLRTFLTGFSVAWGIFMLIVLLGAGNGMKNGIMSNFRNFSLNRVETWPRYTSKPYKGMQMNRRIEYKDEDEVIEKFKGSGRSIDEIYVEEILPDKMRYNLKYIEEFSVINDIKIMIKTAVAVVK